MRQRSIPNVQAGNRLALLDSGRDYFPALLHAIAQATQEIFLETYLFADDAVGHRVAAALCDAARRGVVVRVVVDGFGARRFPEIFGPELTAAGVRYRIFRKEIALFTLSRHRLRRLHRKLAVVDGRIAFVGGINITDDATPLGPQCPSLDYAVRIEGPLVAHIRQTVARMWRFRRNAPKVPPVAPAPECSDAPSFPVRSAAFLLRDNLRYRNTIAHAYLQAIRSARQSVLIANAYFLPGFRFRRALRKAVQRGVAVTVLLQGHSDHPLLRYATQAIYEDLLADGIRVFEYRRGFLHAKVAVVDGQWATVGSSNIDPFSLFLAREANVVVKDENFAATLSESLARALEEAEEWTRSTLHHQPLHMRLARHLSYGLVKFLVSLAGYEQ